MSKGRSIQGCISSKLLNYFSSDDFPFSFLPTLSCISLPTTQAATKREIWLSETESHHVGSGATRCQSECCIRAGETWASWPWHSSKSTVPTLMLRDHAVSSSEVCCIHRFRNQPDGREWALGGFGAPIHACHL